MTGGKSRRQNNYYQAATGGKEYEGRNKVDERRQSMAEVTFTCEVSCQLCGWHTGGSLSVDEANLFAEILRFLGQCWQQHSSQSPSGKLQVTWEPLETVAH